MLSPWLFSRLTRRRLDVAVAEPDALEQLVAGPRVGGLAGHLDEVGLLDAEARVHQPIGQVAVVGQQQQPLAVLVEPADGVDALADVRHQVDGQRPAGRVVIGAEVAARLVDQPVDRLFRVPDRLAIDGDALLARIDLACPARGRRGRRSVTRPAAISSSQWRREPTPAWARNLLIRSMLFILQMLAGFAPAVQYGSTLLAASGRETRRSVRTFAWVASSSESAFASTMGPWGISCSERRTMISPELLEIFTSPMDPSRSRLALQGDQLICERCRLQFKIKDGFPVLIAEEAELPPGCGKP